MNNENPVAKPAVEQTAVAERTRGGCCFRPNVDILEQNDELSVPPGLSVEWQFEHKASKASRWSWIQLVFRCD